MAADTDFRYLKVGDQVTRSLAGFPMLMQVTEVKEDVVVCAAVTDSGSLFYGDWQFDRDVGCEEDADLGWGKKFGRTGSQLLRK